MMANAYKMPNGPISPGKKLIFLTIPNVASKPPQFCSCW